ncbi:MAG: DsrE family protein [Candidatus Thorarchaeota archaeon]
MGKYIIVCSDGSFDKLQTAALVASGAIMNDHSVVMFFMHDAVWAMRKNNPSMNLKSKTVYPEVSEKIEKVRTEGKLVLWNDLLEDLKDIGKLEVIVCAQITEILGLSKDDFIPLVDQIAGVATLTEESIDADHVISF